MNTTAKRTELIDWKFTLDQTEYGLKAGWEKPEYDDCRWGDATSYSCWENREDAMRDYEGHGWFRAWVEVNTGADIRNVLKFDGMGGASRIFVNGVEAGGNEDRYLPFAVDITDFVKPGKNLLAILVDNSFQGPEYLPGGQRVEWVLYGGLTHHVYLEEQPAVYISHVRADAKADGSLSVTVTAENRGAEDFCGQVSYRVAGLALTGLQQIALAAGETKKLTFQAQGEQVKLWSPEEPNLYDLQVALETDGKPHYEVNDRIGFRTIEVRGIDFYLNGKQIYLKGANRYDEYYPFGICAPEDKIREDLLEMKKCGMNLVRVHYPQDDVHYRIADEIGLMYMIEVPVNWVYPKSYEPFEQYSALADRAADALHRIFREFCNHACWTVWSLGNECGHSMPACQQLFRMLNDLARSYDSGRLITFASCRDLLDSQELDFCDFLSLNYYSGVLSEHVDQFPVQMHDVLSYKLGIAQKLYPNMPHVMTEFGYPCVYGIHGSSIEGRFTEEFGYTFLKAACAEYQADPNMRGLIIWSWADYRHRRGLIGAKTDMHLQATFGPFGLVTVDRKKKQGLVDAITEVYTAWQPEE